MKRVVLLISMLAMGISLSAQQNQHSNYFGLEIGGGHNGLTYKADNGSYYLGWGFQGGLRYAHFFGSHFGMGLGVQAARTFTLDKVPEHKMFSYLNIPVEFYWRAPLCKTCSFLFGLGGSMDMPLGGEKAMTEKIGASILADLGFNYQLCNNWGLYMGIYGSYSFTDMYETDVQVPDLRLYNVGLKLGLNVGWSCHSGNKDAKGGDSDMVAYDNDADNSANSNNYSNNNYSNNAYGNNNDGEDAAAKEARCNARRMNNPDMAMANSDVDNDIAEAEQMAEAIGNAAAKDAIADAKAKAADAKRAYNNGQYCKAYDLFNEAYGHIADSYAKDAASFAENSSNNDLAKAASDADLYADAAHKDGLGCAMAASRNARINAEIARDTENGTRNSAAAYNDPSYADFLAGEALTMAEDANSKAAKTDAKDASGKAYRGNLADSYAASAKSFAGSAAAYAAKSNNPDAKAAAEEAQRYAAEVAEAARMGDVAGAYRAARAAQQAADRARRIANGDEAQPAASQDAAAQQPANGKPADKAQLQKYLDQINATIHYDFGSTEPKYDNKTDLAIRALSAAMKADSRVKILITGHTDNVGTAEGNMSYGKKRAEALKQLMVNLGAPASSIATYSRGQEEPVVDNDTDEHRNQNRRAVITLR